MTKKKQLIKFTLSIKQQSSGLLKKRAIFLLVAEGNLNAGEDLRHAYQFTGFCVVSCLFCWDSKRGEFTYYFTDHTFCEQIPVEVSSEIFPFEKTVLMDRIRKDFGKGGVRANKTNSVPRKN